MAIKLLQFYSFPDVKGTLDLSGIWETVGVKNFGMSNESWEMVRRFSSSIDSPVGDKEELPVFVFVKYCHKIERRALFGDAKRN